MNIHVQEIRGKSFDMIVQPSQNFGTIVKEANRQFNSNYDNSIIMYKKKLMKLSDKISDANVDPGSTILVYTPYHSRKIADFSEPYEGWPLSKEEYNACFGSMVIDKDKYRQLIHLKFTDREARLYLLLIHSTGKLGEYFSKAIDLSNHKHISASINKFEQTLISNVRSKANVNEKYKLITDQFKLMQKGTLYQNSFRVNQEYYRQFKDPLIDYVSTLTDQQFSDISDLINSGFEFKDVVEAMQQSNCNKYQAFNILDRSRVHVQQKPFSFDDFN